MELRNWAIFGLLEPEFVSEIKLACVFGNLGYEAIVVTKCDQVYSLGSNSAGCLGIDNLCSSLTPMKVEALCNKEIQGFSYGAGPHVLAFTRSGEVYSWGHNSFAQLGLNSTCQTVVPTLVTGSIQSKKVVQVACGSHHSMALDSTGEVYCWGQNTSGQVGCGSTANQPTPRRVSAVIGNSKIVYIACGQTSSFAISDAGELFGWGYNGTSNLGIGNTVNQYNPTKVFFNAAQQNIFVRKVACGTAHTLVLTDDGSLYTFGANSYGQLGTGHKSNVVTPTRVAIDIGRVIDIAATHYGHISVCQTHTKVYMWGQCRGQAITTPVETPFKNMHDAFACYSSPPVTWIPIEGTQTYVQSIIEALKLAFDDPKTGDVGFVLDGKTIHCHKAILRIRSEHFRSMFSGKWEENSESVIPVEPGVSYAVFRAFLQYLYTDKIELNPVDALDLLKVANYYCESKLQTECESLIKQSITIENAARLYASAIAYNAKDLEEFTFQYMLHHFTAITQSDSFLELDGESVKSLIIQLSRKGAFRY